MKKNLYKEFIKFIPSSKMNLERLQFLKEQPSDLRIAVFGKYNHGKSTLLNALIGHDEFKTADKRETIKNKEYKKDNITWIDTPGLDADTAGKDDAEARRGAFKTADFLFLVHNVKTGELDRYEKKLYQDLMKQDKNYKNKMFLVLTQIDQLSEKDLEMVLKEIYSQMPDLKIIPISAIRYLKGIKEQQQKFIELSGMTELFNLTGTLNDGIKKFRKKEIKRLIDKAKIELKDLLNHKEKELRSIQHKVSSNNEIFEAEVLVYQSEVLAYKANSF